MSLLYSSRPKTILRFEDAPVSPHWNPLHATFLKCAVHVVSLSENNAAQYLKTALEKNTVGRHNFYLFIMEDMNKGEAFLKTELLVQEFPNNIVILSKVI